MQKDTQARIYTIVSGKAVCSECGNGVLTGSGGVDVCENKYTCCC